MMWSSLVNSALILATEHYSNAAKETRVLVTIDTDFGQLIFLENLAHAGLIRLPDVAARERLLIVQDLLTRFEIELQDAAIITVRGGRIRISKGPKHN